MEALLEMRHVSREFGVRRGMFDPRRASVKAVNDVSLSLAPGETLGLVGESGCGKSVTASSIMQLLPRLARIEEGQIIYHSEDRGDIEIQNLPRNGKEMRELRGKDIAMIFQDPMTALNPVMTVGEQIGEAIDSADNFADTMRNLGTMTMMISVSLGIMNLLPIPALDGGRFLIYVLEAIRRKPLPKKVEEGIVGATMLLLLALMALVFVKDIFF